MLYTRIDVKKVLGVSPSEYHNRAEYAYIPQYLFSNNKISELNHRNCCFLQPVTNNSVKVCLIVSGFILNPTIFLCVFRPTQQSYSYTCIPNFQ